MDTREKAFGIDFGTTNTRVAYYDGRRVQMVRFETENGDLGNELPTLVSYQGGEAVAFGSDARSRGRLLPQSVKWILDREEPVEVDGGARYPIDIATDFFRNLRRLVEESLGGEPLTRAAVTIPVHYPYKARMQLLKACKRARIEVTHFYFEPIAAIYCSLLAQPVSGVTAVFDWGGGSLDIATVEIRDGIILTRQIDGWHRGGVDFDHLICRDAANDFLAHRQGHPALKGLTADELVRIRPELRLQAEAAKIKLSKVPDTLVEYSGFVGGENLEHSLTRTELNDLIDADVTSAVERLDQALRASEVTPRVLARLFLSGGTCHIPAIRDRLAGSIAGHRTVGTLQLPDGMIKPSLATGTDDIGNATAIGAALLSVHAAEPIFASSLGIRLADASGDQFYPIFTAGEEVSFQPKTERFFVTDTTAGVARLLICDEGSASEPGGRLLRIVTVPIARDETWIHVRFTLDRHLVLRVDAAGRKALRNDSFDQIAEWPHEPTWIQRLNLGFRIPD